MRASTKLAVVVLTGSAALLAAGGVALADNNAALPGAAAAAETPPSIVEDFTYPGAADILAKREILLKKGDGNIILEEECAPGGDYIQIKARLKGPYCFRVRGNSGWLTLELTEAFVVLGDSRHTTEAKFTINGVPDTATIEPGSAEGIGEGAGGRQAVLLELRATA